jgi:hypothetical protein
VIRRDDYLVPTAGGKFDAEEYDAHPERYRSIFAEKVYFHYLIVCFHELVIQRHGLALTKQLL